jgi:hypothetical protein
MACSQSVKNQFLSSNLFSSPHAYLKGRSLSV